MLLSVARKEKKLFPSLIQHYNLDMQSLCTYPLALGPLGSGQNSEHTFGQSKRGCSKCSRDGEHIGRVLLLGVILLARRVFSGLATEGTHPSSYPRPARRKGL